MNALVVPYRFLSETGDLVAAALLSYIIVLDGDCPGRKVMADDLGISLSSLDRARKQLEDMGLATFTIRHNGVAPILCGEARQDICDWFVSNFGIRNAECPTEDTALGSHAPEEARVGVQDTCLAEEASAGVGPGGDALVTFANECNASLPQHRERVEQESTFPQYCERVESASTSSKRRNTPVSTSSNKRNTQSLKPKSLKPGLEDSSPSPTEKAPAGSLFVKACEVCGYDMATLTKRQRQMLNSLVGFLVKQGESPESLARFAIWWRRYDWRGKQGSRPHPGQIRAEWASFSFHEAPRIDAETIQKIRGVT